MPPGPEGNARPHINPVVNLHAAVAVNGSVSPEPDMVAQLQGSDSPEIQRANDLGGITNLHTRETEQSPLRPKKMRAREEVIDDEERQETLETVNRPH